MRTLPRVFLLLAALLLLTNGTGCPAAIDPGADPVIVHLERSVEIAYESVDAFLRFHDENRALLAAKIPAVHDVAVRLKRVDANGKNDVKEAFRAARVATALYKSSRTADASADAEAKLKAVQEFARQAREALVKAQAAKGAE